MDVVKVQHNRITFTAMGALTAQNINKFEPFLVSPNYHPSVHDSPVFLIIAAHIFFALLTVSSHLSAVPRPETFIDPAIGILGSLLAREFLFHPRHSGTE
jgi:hypothetical protein